MVGGEGATDFAARRLRIGPNINTKWGGRMLAGSGGLDATRRKTWLASRRFLQSHAPIGTKGDGPGLRAHNTGIKLYVLGSFGTSGICLHIFVGKDAVMENGFNAARSVANIINSIAGKDTFNGVNARIENVRQTDGNTVMLATVMSNKGLDGLAPLHGNV